MATDSKCEELVLKQATQGQFVSHEVAKGYVRAYLNDTGARQPNETDPAHIFGYVFGLNNLKQFLLKIDAYNVGELTVDKQITAVRVYRAKSSQQDLVLVPVMRSGVDCPKSLINKEKDDGMYLSGAGPCPNVCNNLLFINA